MGQRYLSLWLRVEIQGTESGTGSFSTFICVCIFNINARRRASMQAKCFSEHISTAQPCNNYNKPVKISWKKKDAEFSVAAHHVWPLLLSTWHRNQSRMTSLRTHCKSHRDNHREIRPGGRPLGSILLALTSPSLFSAHGLSTTFPWKAISSGMAAPGTDTTLTFKQEMPNG